jgi:mono/diheme cytochrome c family protein
MLNEHDMLMLLNFELSAYDECAGCHFTGLKPSFRDETGSNWRGARLESEGAMTEAARNAARHVLDEVHEEYNLE